MPGELLILLRRYSKALDVSSEPWTSCNISTFRKPVLLHGKSTTYQNGYFRINMNKFIKLGHVFYLRLSLSVSSVQNSHPSWCWFPVYIGTVSTCISVNCLDPGPCGSKWSMLVLRVGGCHFRRGPSSWFQSHCQWDQKAWRHSWASLNQNLTALNVNR